MDMLPMVISRYRRIDFTHWTFNFLEDPGVGWWTI